MHTEIVVYGAGGHGKVVLDAILRLGQQPRLFDDDRTKYGEWLLGIPVESPSLLSEDDFCRVHVAIGSNSIRRRISVKLGGDWVTLIHPQASVADSSCIGRGCFIAAAAVLAPDCVLGEGSIVNHGAVVDHDCRIGSFCHVSPNATLGGEVTIGQAVLIGSGAVVLPGVSVSDGATVGAGAVVTHDVAAQATVHGVPAKSV